MQSGHTLQTGHTLHAIYVNWPHLTCHLCKLATPYNWPHPTTGHTSHAIYVNWPHLICHLCKLATPHMPPMWTGHALQTGHTSHDMCVNWPHPTNWPPLSRQLCKLATHNKLASTLQTSHIFQTAFVNWLYLAYHLCKLVTSYRQTQLSDQLFYIVKIMILKRRVEVDHCYKSK